MPRSSSPDRRSQTAPSRRCSAIERRPGSTAAGGASEAICGSQLSHDGRYQFQSPRSFIVAGSSTARTIVASIRTASARPTPISLKSIELSVAKIEKTPTMTIAALVTTPAVERIPCDTASSVGSPRSWPSRTRLRMKTW